MTNTQLHLDHLELNARARTRSLRTAAPAGTLYFAPLGVVLDWPARAAQEMAATRQRRGWLPVAERAARQLRRSEAAVIATFLLETPAGRDAIAAAVLDAVGNAGDRKGFDGLLATVLQHLQVTNGDRLADAVNLWSSTDNTAPIDRPVVAFDAATNTVTALGRDAFDPGVDPFGRGLAVDSPVNSGHGETMDGDGSCELMFEILGALLAESGPGLVGVVASHDLGMLVCGDTSEPGGGEGAHGASGSPHDVDLPRDDPNNKQNDQEEKEQQEKQQEEEEKSQDSKGDGDDHPDKGGSGWPNPEEGYPAPDDGGGTPWGRVDVAAIPSLADLAPLRVRTGDSSEFSVAPLMAALHTGTNALDPSRGVFSSLANGGEVARVTQLQLAGVTSRFAGVSADVSATIRAVATNGR